MQALGLQRRFGSPSATPFLGFHLRSALRAGAQRTSPGLQRPYSGVSRWARLPWACQPSNFPSRAFSAPQGFTSHRPLWPYFMPQPLIGFIVSRAFPALAAVTVSGPLPSCHYETTNATGSPLPEGHEPTQHLAVPWRREDKSSGVLRGRCVACYSVGRPRPLSSPPAPSPACCANFRQHFPGRLRLQASLHPTENHQNGGGARSLRRSAYLPSISCATDVSRLTRGATFSLTSGSCSTRASVRSGFHGPPMLS